MSRWWPMLLAGAGCSQILGVKDITLSDGGSGGGSDSAFTACITDPTITLFKPCFATLPASDYTMPPGSYDTDACSAGTVQSQGMGKPDVCVVAGMTLKVTAPIRPYGSRPLVLAAVTDLTVSAMIDVRGGNSAQPAAGANPAACTNTNTPGMNDGVSPSGGAGGAFGGSSGGGGAGAGGTVPGAGTGGIGKLMFVRGGCNGTSGGSNMTGGAMGGAGGTAGGALYLVAGNSVTVTPGATIAAAGGGGGGGTQPNGAGGGGASGGLIAIEAPTLGINGVLYANGAGGGGGATSAQVGGSGMGGTLSTAAGGSAGGAGAGDGGMGGVDTTIAGVGGGATQSNTGAGGGGGSIGFIFMNYTFADTSGSSISPPETGP